MFDRYHSANEQKSPMWCMSNNHLAFVIAPTPRLYWSLPLHTFPKMLRIGVMRCILGISQPYWSGLLAAILTAIRRASSLVSGLAADRGSSKCT